MSVPQSDRTAPRNSAKHSSPTLSMAPAPELDMRQIALEMIGLFVFLSPLVHRRNLNDPQLIEPTPFLPHCTCLARRVATHLGVGVHPHGAFGSGRNVVRTQHKDPSTVQVVSVLPVALVRNRQRCQHPRLLVLQRRTSVRAKDLGGRLGIGKDNGGLGGAIHGRRGCEVSSLRR